MLCFFCAEWSTLISFLGIMRKYNKVSYIGMVWTEIDCLGRKTTTSCKANYIFLWFWSTIFSFRYTNITACFLIQISVTDLNRSLRLARGENRTRNAAKIAILNNRVGWVYCILTELVINTINEIKCKKKFPQVLRPIKIFHWIVINQWTTCFICDARNVWR